MTIQKTVHLSKRDYATVLLIQQRLTTEAVDNGNKLPKMSDVFRNLIKIGCNHYQIEDKVITAQVSSL